MSSMLLIGIQEHFCILVYACLKFMVILPFSVIYVAQESLLEPGRPQAHVIRIIEGFETVMFRSKFEQWPQKNDAVVSDESRGKVAG